MQPLAWLWWEVLGSEDPECLGCLGCLGYWRGQWTACGTQCRGAMVWDASGDQVWTLFLLLLGGGGLPSVSVPPLDRCGPPSGTHEPWKVCHRKTGPIASPAGNAPPSTVEVLYPHLWDLDTGLADGSGLVRCVLYVVCCGA